MKEENKHKWKRIEELEKRAKDRFINYSDWDYVIECLDEDEQEEYKKLLKEVE